MTTCARVLCAVQSASARGSGKSGSCSPITTRTGAVMSHSRASAGAWLVRVVTEKALAYPGRRRPAATWSQYSAKSAGRRPAYSFGRYDFQEMAAHGGGMAARSRIRFMALIVAPPERLNRRRGHSDSADLHLFAGRDPSRRCQVGSQMSLSGPMV